MSHYKPYPACKDSGVEWIGPVPEHWEVKRLRHVATLNPSPDWQALGQQQRDYPFLPMEAIGEAGELDCSGRKPLDDCRSGYTYFAEGDVAYAKVTPCFENGKGAVMRGLDGGHGFGTTELTVLRPTAIDRDYLYALTFADSFRQPGASEMLGSGGLKRVPDEFTRNYRAAIPPPAEQTAIAAALDRETARIAALIAKKTRLIELLKEKRQALITHAVTKGLDPNVKMKASGVDWIGSVPEHWEVKRLRHVATLNPSPDWQALEQQQREYPFLPMEAIGEAGGLDCSGRKPLDNCRSGYTYFAEGDVTYAKVTPCFENGKGAVMRGLDGGHGFGTTELTVLRPTAIDRDYLYALTFADSFRQPGASEMLGSGGLKRVPDEFTRNYRTAIPPRDEQTAIAAALDRETARIDALIAKARYSITLLKERRSALITAAVTGQIDLRDKSWT